MPFFRKLTYTRVRDWPNFYPNIRTQFTLNLQFVNLQFVNLQFTLNLHDFV